MAGLSTRVDPAPIATAPEGGSDLVVAGTGVPLERVIGLFRAGRTPEAIVNELCLPSLGAVYRVIGHYLEHQRDLDAYVDAREADERAGWEEIRRNFSTTPLHERLATRLRRDDPSPR